MHISQDPIRLAGGLTLYPYVDNPNSSIDILGLLTCEELDAKAKEAHNTIDPKEWWDVQSTTAIGENKDGLFVSSSKPQVLESIREWTEKNNVTVVDSGKVNVHAEESLHNSGNGINKIGSSRPICSDCEAGMNKNNIEYNKENTSGKQSRNRTEGHKYEGTNGEW